MNLSIHLAPNIPWIPFVLATAVLVAIGVWTYRFAVPPLPALAKRALPVLRVIALGVLLWLLAQPVLERAHGGGGTLFVLLDRSRSMDLPVAAGGAPRSQVAAAAAAELSRAWHGPVRVVPFAGRLGNLEPTAAPRGTAAPGAPGGDSLGRGATALGDALDELGRSPAAERASAVVVVSDGVVNAGSDPAAAARSLGLPVHGVLVGGEQDSDRSITGIDASATAEVGRETPVRVRVTTTEPRGVAFGVQLRDGNRELGRATVTSPGSGAEAIAEFRVTPAAPGLALWTAHVDSLAGEITAGNNERQVAVEVAPAKLGVVMISGGLNWDFAFLRRALAADSSLAVTAWVRSPGGWTAPDHARAGTPSAGVLGGMAVVVLDAIAPRDVAPGFDAALRGFVANGGAVLAFGGPAPGVLRYQGGAFTGDLALAPGPAGAVRAGAPEPAPEARDVLQWDDDPARGERAWQAAAPLDDVAPIAAGAGDRVLVRSVGQGPPLLFVRRIGRGQLLLVNGSGVWRWSLSGTDELSAERGRRLWRSLVHTLAEPVQGEPLRVRPEHWLTPQGETVRVFATLQDAAFRPVAGATLEGELIDASGHARAIAFVPGTAGSYVAAVDALAPGRYRVTARASRGGGELARATSQLAVDRWSLEDARTQPDSASLASLARASGGRVARARGLPGWARTLETRGLGRASTESLRLWESPWVFAVVVGALSLEWAWRRRRGLP